MKVLEIGSKIEFKYNTISLSGVVIDVLENGYTENDNVYIVDTDFGIYNLDNNYQPYKNI